MDPYFKRFESREPAPYRRLTRTEATIWQYLAVVTLGLGAWYLYWRWTASLNWDAPVFSITVVLAETALYFGTALFIYDIWDEGDTSPKPAAGTRSQFGFEGPGLSNVDIFITTYDEDVATVAPSIAAAKEVMVPPGWTVQVHLLDDGNRITHCKLALEYGVNYITRNDNVGYKAGNLKNALFETEGDIIAICDADTRLFPTFLEHTLGYFRDPNVAWVQTPHWFYDIPPSRPVTLPKWARYLPRALHSQLTRIKFGADPFISDPSIFFDIILRRRNRHGASFCCGAGSLHRRQAVLAAALRGHARDRNTCPMSTQDRRLNARLASMQPFRFHVSEDIYTSSLLHADQGHNWRSVYHPQPEAKMLSPWSLEAWAQQRLKYAGGTFDIMMRNATIWSASMPWRIRLHYLGTFWSYLSIIWMTILLLAPAITLFSGVIPIQAYSLEFFVHLIPVLILNELALLSTSKGHALSSGRTMALATLPISWRAFWLAVFGRKFGFKPTPKSPILGNGYRFVAPHIGLLFVLMAALAWGLAAFLLGSQNHTASLLLVNAFWISWNGFALVRIISSARWSPEKTLQSIDEKESQNGYIA